jgi:hypothetical protein
MSCWRFDSAALLSLVQGIKQGIAHFSQSFF